MSVLEQFDPWLAPDGPVAVTMREPLEPVLGKGAVIFPPTFAPPAKGESAASHPDLAPGGPGAAPYWAIGRKDGIGSAYNR